MNAITISARSTSRSGELVAEDEREQQIERPLERVEVELELADRCCHGHRPQASPALPDAALRARYRARPLGTAIFGRAGSGWGRGLAFAGPSGRSRPVRAAATR